MKKSRTIKIITTVVAAGGILFLASCGDELIPNESESSTLAEEITQPIFNQGELNNQHPNNEYESGIYNDPTYMNPDNQTSAVTQPQKDEEPTEDTSDSMAYLSNGNGTCILTGIGNCTDACAVIPERSPGGDIVTSIGEKAFYGNTKINAVQIPSTVTSIGSSAFGGCTSLVYISVDTANTAFKDENGVLYSRDMSTLIAYPAAKGSAVLSIPSSVRNISDMAFYKCNSLKTIIYGGTQAEWASVSMGQMNYGLFTASVSCSDSGK